MRIGFEAKRAFCNTTGLGNYCRTLISAIEKYAQNVEIVLFTPKIKIKFSPNSPIIQPVSSLNKLFKSIWRVKTITKQIEQYKLDIYHGLSHEIPFEMHKKVKTVVTMHDLIYLTRPSEFSSIDRKVYDKKFRYACENSHAIVAITKETKKDLIKFFNIAESKIHVIYQSCDTVFTQSYDKKSLTKFRKKIGLPKKYLLYVGSMNPRKKPFELVKAYHLIEEKTDWPLVLVGSGTEKEKILRYVNENSLKKKIIFLEIEQKQELAKLYQCASIFTFPSVYEGFGIPIIEAQFSKTCVITSMYSCLPEVAGPDAIYVNPDKTKDFANTILELIQDKKRREKSARKSFKWVQRYSQENIVDDYMKLYKTLLE